MGGGYTGGYNCPIVFKLETNSLNVIVRKLCLILKNKCSETHLWVRDTHRLKVRRWKKIFHANGNDEKVRVAILISEKVDFKTEAVKKDKEEHYIMIKGSIEEEDITLIDIYTPNIGAPKYIKQILTDIKGEIDNNTIIVGDFNTPLTSVARPSR